MIKKISFEFIKFCIVGVIATLVNYGFFYLFLNQLKVHYLLSSSFGFICGLIVGYPLNKYWTFSSKEKAVSHAAPYLAIYLFSLILSLFFLKIAVDYFKLLPEIANVLVIGLTTCTNFIGTKFFVFKAK